MDAIDTAVLYQQPDLLDGDEEFLEKIRPVMFELVRNLEASSVKARFPCLNAA
jgi:hypothetical protein